MKSLTEIDATNQNINQQNYNEIIIKTATMLNNFLTTSFAKIDLTSLIIKNQNDYNEIQSYLSSSYNKITNLIARETNIDPNFWFDVLVYSEIALTNGTNIVSGLKNPSLMLVIYLGLIQQNKLMQFNNDKNSHKLTYLNNLYNFLHTT
ncbi:hypothetical protein L3V82_12355 [Thiotrichales bacterium 19S3-7]|nr:hypothetical protein [Thiotrichales bacterium 19S3-7]MCF6802982.1 hypothetical protein [Thiotrichales bacterium 19S3-11]